MKTPKAKTSEAEKALAEVGIKQYQITSPLLEKISDRVEAIGKNAEALAKTTVARQNKNMFDALAANKPFLTSDALATTLMDTGAPDEQLTNALRVEGLTQARDFVRKARENTAASMSGLQTNALRLGSREASAFSSMANQRLANKMQNRAAIIGAVGQAAGMVGGQALQNYRNPNVNILGRPTQAGASQPQTGGGLYGTGNPSALTAGYPTV